MAQQMFSDGWVPVVMSNAPFEAALLLYEPRIEFEWNDMGAPVATYNRDIFVLRPFRVVSWMVKGNKKYPLSHELSDSDHREFDNEFVARATCVMEGMRPLSKQQMLDILNTVVTHGDA